MNCIRNSKPPIIERRFLSTLELFDQNNCLDFTATDVSHLDDYWVVKIRTVSIYLFLEMKTIDNYGNALCQDE